MNITQLEKKMFLESLKETAESLSSIAKSLESIEKKMRCKNV